MPYNLVLIVVVLGIAAMGLLQTVRTMTGAAKLNLRDRADLLNVLAIDALMLLLARALVDWAEIPSPLWLLGLAFMAGTAVLGVLVWNRLAWLTPSARKGVRALSVGLGLAATVALGIVLI